ncbi:MAG: beta-propeller fold lactonase family protein [Thermoleophilia bacterium]
MRRIPLLLTLAAILAIAVPSASAATGDLTFASCQSNAAITGQSCTVNAGLLNLVNDLKISPDGKSAYAVATSSNAVVVFDRNATTGALTLKTGSAGCFANASLGSCTVLTGQLSAPQALAISPDGKNVYVVASTSETLVSFDRDTTTGALTQKAGADGCLSNANLSPCTTWLDGLYRAGAITVSPDGKTVYAVAVVHQAPNTAGLVTAFPRDPTTGTLSTSGSTCVSSAVDIQGRCVVSAGVFEVLNATSAKIAVSPDSRNAYLTARSSDSLAIFDRNATTGALTLKSGADGCFANATLGSCTVLSGYLPEPFTVTVSPDGANVYVNSGGSVDPIDTILVFARNATTGALTKLSGATGCLASATLNDCTALNPANQTAANLDSKNVTISPDGLNAYVASLNWNMLLAFDRSTTTGALTLKSGAAGCLANAAMTPCTTVANALYAPGPVAISPDGRNVYTGGTAFTDPGIAVFTRNQAPNATAVAPASGTTAGGTTVVLTGTHLDGATKVLFGDTGAIIKESTYASLTVIAPLHVAGKVDIIITTTNGTGTFAKAYTYVLPAVKSIVAAEKPKASYSKTTITFRTIVTVNAAGTISQTFSRVIKGKRVAVCTRKKTVARAGKYPVVCVAGLTTRNAIKRGQISVRVLTSFAATRTVAVNTVQNLILPRRR